MHRLERTRIESLKTTAVTGDTLAMNNHQNTNDFCKSCGRLSLEAESANTKLLREQEQLLKEINSAKEEVVAKIKTLEEHKDNPNNDNKENDAAGGMAFDMKNLGSLQELLNQAEETDDMLLFLDKKQSVWQIIKRQDINIANAAGENDFEPELVAERDNFQDVINY